MENIEKYRYSSLKNLFKRKKEENSMNSFKKVLITSLIGVLALFGVGCEANITSEVSASQDSETSEVGDTTKPTIEFKASSVTVVLGSEYESSDNIKSVKDDVDGALKETEKAVKNSGYYIIDDSKVDLKTAGEYEVTVTATDKAGNTTKKSFKLTVKEESKGSDSKASDTKSDSSKSDSSTKTDSSKSSSKSSSSKNNTSSKKTTTSSKATNNSDSSASTSNFNSTASTNSGSGQAAVGTDNSPSTAGCNHNWVYYPDEYVTKTRVTSAGYSYQQEITQTAYLCNTHKLYFYSWEEYEAHADETDCGGWQVVDAGTGQYETITVPDTTETYQEQTQWAHYECSICGEWKK